MKPRSSPYLTSAEVTSRSTGGLNFTPVRIFTVTVLPSSAISGGPSARSGSGLVASSGLYEYSGRCVAYATFMPYW